MFQDYDMGFVHIFNAECVCLISIFTFTLTDFPSYDVANVFFLLFYSFNIYFILSDCYLCVWNSSSSSTVCQKKKHIRLRIRLHEKKWSNQFDQQSAWTNLIQTICVRRRQRKLTKITCLNSHIFWRERGKKKPTEMLMGRKKPNANATWILKIESDQPHPI